MKETKQKIDGAYMTPEDIVDKMIMFTPEEWFKGNILEPTAGTGNIVNAILNKKVAIGLTPQEAIDTTFANEFDNERYKELLHRIELWCEYAGAKVNYDHITNMDARELKLDVDYKVITNLPFGSWANSSLPRQIINNLNKPGVYLTKWSTGCNQKFCKSVIKFENVVFPGIVYDCLLWQYDPNVKYEEPQVWIYWPIQRFTKYKLKKKYLTKVRMMINHFRTDNTKTVFERGASHGLYKSNNIKYAGYDLDMEVYGIWLEAINIARLRWMYVSIEILDDFYYTHKGEE